MNTKLEFIHIVLIFGWKYDEKFWCWWGLRIMQLLNVVTYLWCFHITGFHSGWLSVKVCMLCVRIVSRLLKCVTQFVCNNSGFRLHSISCDFDQFGVHMLVHDVTVIIVASLTQILCFCWPNFSHVTLDITGYFTLSLSQTFDIHIMFNSKNVT